MKSPEEWISELDLERELSEIRRDLHRNPELSGEEYRTGAQICRRLEEWGIPCEKGVADTGVVGVVTGTRGPARKTVGIRADMDALPIEEENKTAPYCSVNPGVMHACGHDAHTAILLGTARILKAMENEWAGRVKFFFQPAEETTGGAARMIEAGCLEDPHVDFVLGLHVDPGCSAGQVGIRYGKMYAASDMLTVRVYGRSAHGAHPDEGVDAIVVSANILNTLQTLVSRNICPTGAAVCTFGTIHGGSVRNQIADRVEMQGILRTLDHETRRFARDKIRAVCEQVADAMGARAELIVEESYGPLINNDQVTDVVLRNARTVLGVENVILEQAPDMGTEDFSYFAAARPSCFFHLGCAAPGDKKTVDLHNSRFDIDERCLAAGVKLQVRNALTLLGME
ncbi:M20 metallopeptidase family protein [Bacilliculturomica massiliensis]|uniref:M20 metallopeptidase family protein n=1 Tax=Bacilliculturomica massiliensis TaxID=1917867 RepID=UPI001030E7A0|nr:M20 family metallopeptidase [Bacilliculturomica massiliensis]